MENSITYRNLTMEQRHKTYENYLRDCTYEGHCDSAYESFEEYDDDQMWQNFEFDADTLEFLG